MDACPGSCEIATTFGAAKDFQRFIRRPENYLAWSAMQRLLNDRGRWGSEELNPLLICGPAGCGKSLLISGLAGSLGQRHPGASAKVFHTATWLDAREWVWDAAEKEQALLADFWIAEDIHRLIGEKALEAGLIALLDTARGFGRQLVLTSIDGPSAFRAASDRLASRLAQGTVARIAPLAPESRLAVFRKLAALNDLAVSDSAAAWLSRRLPSSVREIEGILTKLSRNRLEKILELESVTAAWNDLRGSDRAKLGDINHRVAEYFRVRPRSLRSGRRSQSLLLPRQVGMLLARELTGLSLQSVGAFFGNRDHSTVLHACRKVRRDVRKNPTLGAAVEHLRAELQ